MDLNLALIGPEAGIPGDGPGDGSGQVPPLRGPVGTTLWSLPVPVLGAAPAVGPYSRFARGGLGTAKRAPECPAGMEWVVPSPGAQGSTQPVYPPGPHPYTQSRTRYEHPPTSTR